MSKGRATAIGFLAIASWATLAALTTAAGPVPPLLLAAITFGIGGLVGAASWLFRPGALSAMKAPWRVWALGVAGLFTYHVLYFAAVQNAPAIDVSLTAYLWPMLIVVFAAFLPGEKLRWYHVAGTLLGLAGAVLVITRGQSLGFSGGLKLGHYIAFCLPPIWAGYSLLARRNGNVPTDVVAGFCLATAVLSLGLHFMLEQTVWPHGALAWASVIALGIFPLGIGFYAWDYGLKRGDIFILGALSYASPLLSTLILVATGLTQYHWSILVACLVITLGAAVAAKDTLFRRRA